MWECETIKNKMKKMLTRIAATTTLGLALATPVYATDYCPKPVRTVVKGLGIAIADLNAKAWENQFVRMHERNERQLDRAERTILDAQYRIMNIEYHKHCIPHYHQCQHNNATVTMPVPYNIVPTEQPTLVPAGPTLAPLPAAPSPDTKVPLRPEQTNPKFF